MDDDGAGVGCMSSTVPDISYEEEVSAELKRQRKEKRNKKQFEG